VRQRLGVPGMEVWPARRGLGCSVSPWIARTAALSQRVRSEQVPSNDPRLSAVGCVAGHVSKSALLGRHPPPTNPPLVSGPFYCTEPTKYKTGYVRLRHYGTLCVGLIRGKEITCARLWRCRSIRQRKTRACNQFGKTKKTGDAVLVTGTRFIAAIGQTGTVFIDTFATLAEAPAALTQYRSPGYTPLPE
jgi:hypothetical protein